MMNTLMKVIFTRMEIFMNKDKLGALKDVVGKINKTYGAGTVMTASEAAKAGKLTKKVIPTPSHELNNALWCKGLSGIIECLGSSGSGKTSLLIDTIVLNQKENPDFLAGWLETEGSVTEKILKDHGVDLDRLVFVRQEDVGSAESSLDIIRGLINRDNLFDLIVVNSVAGLMPKKEAEDDLEKQNMALVARLLSKFFRVATGDVSKNNIVVAFINQLRDNVGAMYGDPSVGTGGRALGFYADQRIRMSSVKIQASDPIKEEEGVKINFSVKKNRRAGTHNPFTKGTYYARFESGIDRVIPLPQMLVDAGIIENKGAWWYYKNKKGEIITIDGIEGKFSSKNAFINTLRDNKKWYNKMVTELDKTDGTKVQVQTAEEVKETQEENDFINELVRQAAADELQEEVNNN